jgi:1-acyl-sn-glycerol-3-phosphate acyltransferase
MAASRVPAVEPAAGLSLQTRPQAADGTALAKGEYSIASKAIGLATYFLSGALAINVSQFLGGPLKAVNEDWYNAWIAFTKQSFGLLTMTMTQTFAPTKVIVSGDESVRGQLMKSTDGNLILNFPERIVMIANHQIYTDWLYLWWIAYCNGMHGRLYIILKESLKKIPVLGWGMQMSQFIFLKRNWEQDKPNMSNALQKLNKPRDPMWLLLFPEGTNLAPNTRERSAAWAKKNGVPDCRHVLLPRSTGLQFCLDELKGTVDYLYDVTVAYEGVPRGQYAQDIFTLKAGYMEGKPPKSVNMHFRRFAVKDIPLNDNKAFELWLRARWREKDIMIEQYYRTGRLPGDYGGVKYKSGKVSRGCGHMEVPIRASHWYEFLQIFAPMGILAMILYIFYGDLPQKFWKSINKQALQSGTQDLRKAGIQATQGVSSAGSALGGLTLDDFFEPGKQEETFKAGAMAVGRLLNSPSAQNALQRADFIQSFLSDPQKLVKDTVTDRQRDFMHQLAAEQAKRGGTPSLAGAASTRGDFWKQLGAEESSRTGGVMATGPWKKETFWDSLNAEEQSRRGSVLGGPASKKGTFWEDLKAAEVKKNGQTLSPAKNPPLTQNNLARKGNFYDTLKKEENMRKGTVFTLSSSSSTMVASQPSKPGSAATKLPLTTYQTTASRRLPSTMASTAPTKLTSVSRPMQKPATGPAPTKKTSASAPPPSVKQSPAPKAVKPLVQKPVANAISSKSTTAANPSPATTLKPTAKSIQPATKPTPAKPAGGTKPLPLKKAGPNPAAAAAKPTPIAKKPATDTASKATPAKASTPTTPAKKPPMSKTTTNGNAPRKLNAAAVGKTTTTPAKKPLAKPATGPPKLKT